MRTIGRAPRRRLFRAVWLSGVALLVWGIGSFPDARLAARAASPHRERTLARLLQPSGHCRGSTRAHTAITWPTGADRAINRRLQWGEHVPRRVRRWAYLIVPAARADGVDPYLVAGVIRVESNGDPLAWNLDGDAHGLMQVLHAPFEPAANVRLGVSMLASLQRQFGSQDLVVAGYNAGPGSVATYGGVPPFTETRDYVILVDYFRDLFAGVTLSAARVSRFKAADADLRAFHRRQCGTLWSASLESAGRTDRARVA